MDELFESFDAWLEDVGQEILDEENKPMLLNPARLTQMQFVYLPCSEREYLCVCGNVVVHAVKPYELVQGKRNGKYAGFTCFLFNDGEPIAFTVFYNVGEPQPDYIRNTQA